MSIHLKLSATAANFPPKIKYRRTVFNYEYLLIANYEFSYVRN